MNECEIGFEFLNSGIFIGSLGCDDEGSAATEEQVYVLGLLAWSLTNQPSLILGCSLSSTMAWKVCFNFITLDFIVVVLLVC